MREALNNWGGGVKIGRHIISNFRYSDDTTLLSSTEADLTELLKRVKMVSEKAGLYLNVAKTKLMATGEIDTVKLNGEEVEVVDMFQFLGVMITKDAACEKETKRRLALGRSAMGNMKNLWKDRGIALDTKVKLVQTLVFPIVLYGAETWTLRKDLRKKN